MKKNKWDSANALGLVTDEFSGRSGLLLRQCSLLALNWQKTHLSIQPTPKWPPLWNEEINEVEKTIKIIYLWPGNSFYMSTNKNKQLIYEIE